MTTLTTKMIIRNVSRMGVKYVAILVICCIVSVKADGCNWEGMIVDNGEFLAPDGKDGSFIDIGETLSVRCNPGYRPVGSGELVCENTGQIADVNVACQDIDECNAPLPPSDGSSEPSYSFSNSDYQQPSDNTLWDSWGEVDLLSIQRCHSNAMCTNTEGSYVCICLEGYIGDGINCEVDNLPCEPLTLGRHTYLTVNESRYVAFGCQNGYTLYGNPDLRCQRGSWSGVLPICRADENCGDPGIPANGRRWGNSFALGRTVSFECNLGFELVGSRERTCDLRRRRWTGWQPHCRSTERTVQDIALEIKRDLIDEITPYTNSSLLRANLGRSLNVKSLGLDLVLAFDRSSSILEEDFQLGVNFTKALIRKFGVSYDEGGTRVAAITFATDAQIAFNFSSAVDTEEKVFQALDDLQDGLGGGTGLKEALALVRMPLMTEMRNFSKKVLFIFTDGHSNTEDPVVLAQDLRRKGLEIFAVGVGLNIDPDELRDISSRPTASHMFLVENFDQLDTLTQLIANQEVDYSLCGTVGTANLNDSYVAEKAWPWLSIIHENTTESQDALCSGVLICRDWVLTAASGIRFILYPDELTVTVGEHDITVSEGCEQTIAVDNMEFHPQYDSTISLHGNDVALLHLSEPVDLNSCARTICLPTDNDMYSITPYDDENDCYVAGWGFADSGDQVSNVPLQARMKMKSRNTCSNIPRVNLNSQMVCAGERGNRPEVRADAGAPLMCRRSDNTWVSMGITTYGHRRTHSVFTKITNHVHDWIISITGNCTDEHIPVITTFS